MKSYEAFSKYLGGRDRKIVKRSRTQTYANRNDDGSISLVLVNTDILTFRPDGSITLNTDGWQTRMTRERMNDHLPGRWHVYTAKGIMYLSSGYSEEALNYVYADYMAITPDGAVVYEGEPPAEQTLAEVRKRIREYAKGFTEALCESRLRPEGPGGCWQCLMFEPSGMPRRWDHYESHMEEKYYTEPLLINANNRYPVSTMARHALALSYGGEAVPESMHWLIKDQVGKAIVKFLDKVYMEVQNNEANRNREQT